MPDLITPCPCANRPSSTHPAAPTWMPWTRTWPSSACPTAIPTAWPPRAALGRRAGDHPHPVPAHGLLARPLPLRPGRSRARGRRLTMADCGDVTMEPGRFDENRAAVTAAVAAILARGALPRRARRRPRHHGVRAPGLLHLPRDAVIQVDAHLDWRHERGGVRHGQSSPMRRASEMPWVGGMAQVGLSGAAAPGRRRWTRRARTGASWCGPRGASGGHGGGAAAPARGRHVLRDSGPGRSGGRHRPGVGWPSMGGLTYWETVNLFKGLAARGHIVGLDMVRDRAGERRARPHQSAGRPAHRRPDRGAGAPGPGRLCRSGRNLKPRRHGHGHRRCSCACPCGLERRVPTGGQ